MHELAALMQENVFPGTRLTSDLRSACLRAAEVGGRGVWTSPCLYSQAASCAPRRKGSRQRPSVDAGKDRKIISNRCLASCANLTEMAKPQLAKGAVLVRQSAVGQSDTRCNRRLAVWA